jgi:hypothetical protein
LCEARALGSPPDLIRGKKEANGKTAGMCVHFKPDPVSGSIADVAAPAT